MNTMKKTILTEHIDNIENLFDLFYVASYGCNCHCKTEIQDVFYTHRQNTPFSFFEFFLSQPINISHVTKNLNNLWVLAPFAPRLAEQATIAPFIDGNNPVSFEFRKPEVLKSLKLFIPLAKSKLTRESLLIWKNKQYHADDLDYVEVEDRVNASLHNVLLLKEWNYKKQVEYTKGVDTRDAEALLNLLKPLYFEKPDEDWNSIFIPIASSHVYYGGIWVMLPGLSDDDKKNEFRKCVGLRVSQVINKYYLPTLAILHEHWLECLTSKYLKKNKSLPKDFTFSVTGPDKKLYNHGNPFKTPEPTVKDVFNDQNLEVVNELEYLFYSLWVKRKNYIKALSTAVDPALEDTKKDKIRIIKKLQDELIFKSYLVSSENMTRLLCKVIKSAKTLRKADNDNLPACLVVGGAGSGKEKLAKMLRIFSSDYHNGNEYVINMAAIRPGPLTTAIMAGVKASTSGSSNFTYIFDGILQQVRTNSKKHPSTIRLDEFNSMDPDSQGLLLRFLDNSEIVPIGAISDSESPDETNCLIVGIMNEDPEDISREKAMEFFRSGEYLGNFIGDLFYEHFLRIRRLRPDVMYRMIRNGKFVIPSLKERREDIPLLFQVFLNTELNIRRNGESGKDEFKKAHLPLDVLNRLMSKEFHWPGNVRQLQALVKIVAESIQIDAPSFDHYYIVYLPILEKALIEVGLIPAKLKVNSI
jgi:DNA-binding NtrC family response regulator